MATRSAGRVTIRVLPDTTGFRRDLRTALDRIEKVMHAKIPAELVVTRESIRELRRQLSELEVRIKVEPFITQEKLHEIKERVEELNPQMNVGLNTALARARLAAISRPRIVELFVRVNQASLASAAATLAALSGARVLSNVFDKFWDAIKNLDKNAPRIGAIATGIVSLAGGILALTSNLIGLASSFAALGQISVLLPVLFTSTGIAIGVLIAVLKDAKTVLADLAPLFHDLQDALSSNFWNIAAEPIRDMVRTLMPSLKEQLINTSQALGVMTRNLAVAVKQRLTPEYLNEVFDNMNQSIAIASNAVQPLVNAFATLGLFGSRYLPRLSTWLVKLSEDFNRFITDAANDGRLDAWAERGIQAFKDLGRVLYQTGRVFGALSRAAELAGGSGFAELAEGLRKLADIMNTNNFQVTFATIFAGAHTMMQGVLDGLNAIGPGLANFAPTLARIFGSVGKIIENFFENIGTLISNPTLQRGLEQFFSGFLTFMDTLGPAMGPLGEIIGTLAEAAGSLLAQVGPLIAVMAQEFAPVFTQVWEAIKPLIPTLVELVERLLPPFADILSSLATDVLPAVVPVIEKLAPIFADLLVAMAPYIIEFLKAFTKALEGSGPLIQGVADALNFLVDVLNRGVPGAGEGNGGSGGVGVHTVIASLAKVFGDNPNLVTIINTFSTALGFWGGLGTGLANFATGLGAAADAITRFNPLLGGPEGVVNLVSLVVAGFQSLFGQGTPWATFWAGLGTAIELFLPKLNLGPAIEGLIALFALLFGEKPKWDGFWNGLPLPVTLAINAVTLGLNLNVPRWIASFVGFIVSQQPAWTGFWATVAANATTGMINIATAIQFGFPGVAAQVAIGMVSALGSFARGFLAIIQMVPGWMAGIAGGVGAGFGVVLGTLAKLPGQMVAELAGAGYRLMQAGAQLIGDFAAGISSGEGVVRSAILGIIGAITAALPGSPAKIGPLSGQGYSMIRGQHLVEDMVAGMKSRTDAVKKASLDIASAVSFDAAGTSFASVQSVEGALRDRALVHIDGDYYGATPEKVAYEFDAKVRRAALAASLRSVGK